MTILTVACTEQPPRVSYSEPVFNKFGEPSCRPPDVPIGGIYTAAMPICDSRSVAVIPAGTRTATAPTGTATPPATDDDGSETTTDTTDSTDPTDDPTDPTTGGSGTQNQNTQSTQNSNRNTSSTRNQSQSSSGNP